MSDGPHRTLPLRRKWKIVTERADVEAYSAGEVAEALCPALASDWRAEVSASLFRALAGLFERGDQTNLVPNGAQDFAALRAGAQSPLEALLVDVSCDVLRDGRRGNDALLGAVHDSLTERALASIRQVEEHYLREAPERDPSGVRTRLEASIAAAPIAELARALVEGKPTTKDFRTKKRDGVDDGVSLP
jgi:hypothetical protein